jgi:transposase
LGGRRSHDNTAQSSGTGNARAKGPSSRRYTAAQKEQAVRLVRQLAAETGKEAGAISRVAHQLGFGAESVRQWVRQADIDEGRRPGVTSSEAARIRELERENRELRRANEILRRASAFFAAELDRPQRPSPGSSR